MDPRVALIGALDGSKDHRDAYNAWVTKGGFPARVALHPASSYWAQGMRYGTVRQVFSRNVRVTWDGNGDVSRMVRFADILEVL